VTVIPAPVESPPRRAVPVMFIPDTARIIEAVRERGWSARGRC